MREDAVVAAVALVVLEVVALLMVAPVRLRRGGVGLLLGSSGLLFLFLLFLVLGFLLRRRRRLGAGAGAGRGPVAGVAGGVAAARKRREVVPYGALQLREAVASRTVAADAARAEPSADASPEAAGRA